MILSLGIASMLAACGGGSSASLEGNPLVAESIV